MTFEDMMADEAAGGNGRFAGWESMLAYSVPTVDLAANTKTAELWLQAIAGATSIRDQPGFIR